MYKTVITRPRINRYSIFKKLNKITCSKINYFTLTKIMTKLNMIQNAV